MLCPVLVSLSFRLICLCSNPFLLFTTIILHHFLTQFLAFYKCPNVPLQHFLESSSIWGDLTATSSFIFTGIKVSGVLMGGE